LVKNEDEDIGRREQAKEREKEKVDEGENARKSKASRRIY